MGSYGKAKTGDGMGGGLGPALERNPNEHPELNGTPDGPCSHSMGFEGDSGMHGSTTVKHRGASFNFK